MSTSRSNYHERDDIASKQSILNDATLVVEVQQPLQKERESDDGKSGQRRLCCLEQSSPSLASTSSSRAEMTDKLLCRGVSLEAPNVQNNSGVFLKTEVSTSSSEVTTETPAASASLPEDSRKDTLSLTSIQPRLTTTTSIATAESTGLSAHDAAIIAYYSFEDSNSNNNDDDDDDDTWELKKEAKEKASTASLLDDMEGSFSNTLPSSLDDASTRTTQTTFTEALSVADSESDSVATTATAVDTTVKSKRGNEYFMSSCRYDDVGSNEMQTTFALLEQIMPQQPPEFLQTLSSTHDDDDDQEEKTEVDDYVHIHGDDTLIIGELPPDLDRGLGNHNDDEIGWMEEASHELPPVIENKRAEFISATVLKSGTDEEHGLTFVKAEGSLHILTISSTGLFANSALAPFDKMLRINNVNCESLDPRNAAHLLTHLTGAVTLIAQNPGGVSNLVESQITKPSADSRVGIVFQDTSNGVDDEEDELEITRIHDDSLFHFALLHVGDRVVAVNDNYHVNSTTASHLLDSAPQHCAIVAKTKLKTLIAIARRPTTQLPPEFNFLRTMEEEQLQQQQQQRREELQRKQGCCYNSRQGPGACAGIFQMLGNAYVISIVIFGISLSWNIVKEKAVDGSDAVSTILKFMGLFVGGILLGFLVNAPWWFRKVGARFSIAQLFCNAIILASLFVLRSIFKGASLSYSERLGIFFGLFFPLLIIVNLPSVFVKEANGSDGNTLDDRSAATNDDDTFATDIV